ncbi:uncharacterized protein [Prorops nasuta]|uniref:uncharacterized protein n=1 Tax=Prorops nasuta TaxID=863751 RepID=UPI0034CFD07B
MMLRTEDLKIDVAQVLGAGNFSVLEKVDTFCKRFYERLENRLKETAIQESEFEKERKEKNEYMCKLDAVIKSLQSNIDTIALNEKVTEKKILSVITKKELVKNEIAKLKNVREALMLETVDLKEEKKKREKEKTEKWDALKKACTYYKHKLDIRIDLETTDDHEIIHFYFFYLTKSKTEEYCVKLLNKCSCWEVENINPELNLEHLNDLINTTDISQPVKIMDITSFLCKLRDIFKKHYYKQ